MLSKKFGKTIKLFLMDADPHGRIICELSNWTGKAFRIPRGHLKACSDRFDLQSTAVYFLFGKAESSLFKPKVYIGEAENVYKRLTQHMSEKEFWNEAVVFISKDENLNKAHIKYMESCLYELAVNADRYHLLNGNRPTKSSISEADEAEMSEFIEYIKVLMSTMGFKLFEPLADDQQLMSNEDNDFLFVSNKKGGQATGQRTSEGFVVFKGSSLSEDVNTSYPNAMDKIKNELIQQGFLRQIEGNWVFDKNYEFSSPSTAASLIMGKKANGLIEWKDLQGKNLKQIELQELNESEKSLKNIKPESMTQ